MSDENVAILIAALLFLTIPVGIIVFGIKFERKQLLRQKQGRHS